MSARVVMLTGGSPWGLTLSGGKDFGSFLQIMKVTTHTLCVYIYILYFMYDVASVASLVSLEHWCS